MLQYYGICLVGLCGLSAYRSEIYQFDLALIIYHDIIRADIPVHKTILMYLVQRFKYRLHKGEHCRLIKLSSHSLQVMFQIHTIDIFHNDISGSILIEEILHRNNALQLIELREISRLFHITLQTFVIDFLLVLIRCNCRCRH